MRLFRRRESCGAFAPLGESRRMRGAADCRRRQLAELSAEPTKSRALRGAAGVSSNRSIGTTIALAQPQLRSARSSRCPHPTGRRKKMICNSIFRSRAVAPASAHWSAMPGFVRKTADTVSDLASVVRNLVMDVRDSYRPELHYMRGPGPKWRAKHQPWLRVGSDRPHSRVC